MNFKKILFSLVLVISTTQSMYGAFSDFFETIIKGDVSQLKKYWADHITDVTSANNHLSAKDEFLKSVLNVAVEDQNNPEIVRFLLDKGANKDGTDNGGYTALYRAISRYHQLLQASTIDDVDLIENVKKMIIILLKRGANPNIGRISARNLDPQLIKDITK